NNVRFLMGDALDFMVFSDLSIIDDYPILPKNSYTLFIINILGQTIKNHRAIKKSYYRGWDLIESILIKKERGFLYV
ncbi:MAG: hypothetical protein ACR2PV_07215, partial [Gammaproteobacteria bacterium]